jgi:YVTN family beta-propeller protein/autotransporter-associated beta strand protein
MVRVAAPTSRASTRRAALVGFVCVGALAVFSQNAAWAQQGPFLYVPQFGDNRVSVVDTPSNTALAPAIVVGTNALTAAVRGDEALVYVTNRGSNNVSVINTATNSVVATITVGTNPNGVAISPDGTLAYVTNFTSNNVSVINTASNSVVATVAVGNTPDGVAVSTDGTRAYVVNVNSNNVSVINTSTNSVVATVPVGTRPAKLAVSPDGTRLYVTNDSSNNVSVINTATNSVVATIAVGTKPVGVAVSPDGSRAYVVNDTSSSVSVINTATNSVVTTITVGSRPAGVAVSPDGKRVYVTNVNSNNVSVIDAESNSVTTSIAVGNAPRFPGICSNGNALLASGLTFTARTSGALACTLASGPSGASGPVFTGGTLQIAGADVTSTLPITLQSQGGTIDTNGNNATLAGAVSGPGSLAKIGSGTLTLSGSNSYSGGTALNAGTLAVGSNSALGTGALTFASGTTLQAAANGLSLANAMTLNGTGTVDTQANALRPSGNIDGSGGLTKIGSGTLTLSGPSTYTGATNVNAGTLQAGVASAFSPLSAFTVASGATLDLNNFEQNVGSLAGAGAVTLGSARLFTGSDNTSTTFSGTISGSGGLTKIGPGTLTLSGVNAYSGATAVSAGALRINGSLGAGGVNVGNGATLTGAGSIGGAVTVQNGGTLAGASGSTLTIGSLVLNASSNVNVALLAPNNTTMFNVTGNLTLAGTLNVTDAGGYGSGVYRLFDYGGGLTNNGIAVGNQPAGFQAVVNTATAQQVNLTVFANAAATQFWQGGSAPVGGSGVWNATNTNWLNANSATSTTWGGMQGIFQGTPGTVTMQGAQAFTSLEFVVDGYKLVAGSGGALTPTGTAQLWAEGASTTATIAVPITGGGGIVKIGAGTIVLSGNNSYSGGTAINAGTLAVSSDGNLGDSSGGLAFGGGTLQFLSGFTTSRAVTLTSGGGTFDTNGNNSTLAGTISGTGGLTKIGSGTLTLSGTSTYSGPTMIAGGLINFNSASNFGSGTITLNGGGLQWASGTSTDISSSLAPFGSNGATFDTNGNNVTLASTLLGIGGLTKIGSGTLTLSGNNSYSGGTTINAGTLAVGSNSALGTGALTFASGTALQAAANGLSLANAMILNGTDTVDTQTNALTLAGVLSGSGGLTKTGSGTLILTNANTYSGGTAINAGTLRLENNQALGTGALTTTGSVVDYANGVTIPNPIVLNSNTTQLQVLAGTATQAGVISELNGPRPLEKIGGGTLVLTATNTYSGPTTITAGTLQLGNGGTSGSILGNVVNNATFAVNRSDLFTFGGVISGTGTFQQNGTGTTVLTAINTYSGSTSVNAGTLVVSGSIANSAVIVNNGATLAGSGTVGTITVNSGGTLAPGNTPLVQGSLAFQSGSFYLVQVTPSMASSTNVGGSAALAGTVQAGFASGSYATRTYTILSAAGGLNGTTFNALTTSNLPAGFTASLSYTATNAILNLTATLGAPSSAGPSGPSALACVFSLNQCNVANALNGFFNNGGALPPAFVTIFGLTGANLANALTLLSGEAATGGQQVAFQLTNQFLGIMLDPFVDGRSEVNGRAIGFAPEREELPEDIALAYAKLLKEPPKPQSFDQRWSVWGAGYGGSNRTTGDPLVVGSHDLSATMAGGAAGLDYRLARGTVVGFALAGGGTNWGLAQGLGGGKSDAFQVGLYGTARSGPAYLAAALAYTDHWMSTDRFAFAGDHLTATFNAQSFGGRVESGYRFATIYGGLTPYAAIQSQAFHTPGYTETDLNSGGFALGYNARNATDTRSELGGRFDRLLLLSPDAALTLRARVAWAHDWISDPSLAALFQTLPGASFVVNGATPAKNSALTSAGAELRLANGVILLGKFDGQFASHSSTYAGTGTVRYTW